MYTTTNNYSCSQVSLTCYVTSVVYLDHKQDQLENVLKVLITEHRYFLPKLCKKHDAVPAAPQQMLTAEQKWH